jgi:osmoprotectant transport system permease protein
MNILDQLIEFLSDPAHWSGPAGIPTRLLEHLQYTGLALLVATAIALPVGLIIGHTGKGAFLAINAANAARSLPTLGLLTLVVLIAGIGITPVLVALVALAIPPILTATYAGIRSVEPEITDAARGMGMKEHQVLLKAELPVAMPLVISGLRSATLQVVATATIAAFVALGGLGRFLIDGLAVLDYSEMLAGAVLVALLAIVLDGVFAVLRRLVVSDGLTGRVRRATTATEELAVETTH